MTTQTTTLADFLLARIAEDETMARNVHLCGCGEGGTDVAGDTPCDCPVPARVLAECEAKRRIVELVGPAIDDVYSEWTENILRLLATVYADHPDYRDEWRP